MVFKPGESGNPKGRPKKGLAWAEIINKVSEDLAFDKENNPIEDSEGNHLTYREVIVRKAMVMAANGDKDARKWLAERSEGKPIQPISTEASKSWYDLWEDAGSPE